MQSTSRRAVICCFLLPLACFLLPSPPLVLPLLALRLLLGAPPAFLLLLLADLLG